MNAVDRLKTEYDAIARLLRDRLELSLLNDLNKHFRKVLLLSAGSYFESQISKALSDYVSKATNGDARLVNFLQKAAISGRYHTLFEWGKQNDITQFGDNANKFWSFFGNEFKTQISSEVRGRPEIADAIKAFIEVGHLRNILVHSNLAAYEYDDKTTDEIYFLFKRAEPFVSYVRQKLHLD
ncbi:HEPN domain-containing protein [Chryseosolibacter indicus]|uniref:RiboL-PSP-HEPN domain-containing protein n=1 Tax=Chryseosolibacter indicus TaxID=2782351 RepID=A0ABS5VZP0_9BACT|nr:HEPN domain-containing protein [Chryseosolibacter indicus]MBT1706327.1 hypothetical protein [Chryseosolibacter indicus]